MHLPHCWHCGANSVLQQCTTLFCGGAGHFPCTLVVLRNTVMGFVWGYAHALYRPGVGAVI